MHTTLSNAQVDATDGPHRPAGQGSMTRTSGSSRRPARGLGLVAGLLLGVLVAPAISLAQPNPGAIDRLRRQQKIVITPQSSLQQRLFATEESKGWEVRIELRLPEPRVAGANFKSEDFISEDRQSFRDPNRPRQSVDGKSRFAFDKARIVFPVPERTAGSLALRATYSAKVQMDGRDLLNYAEADQPWETGLRSGTRLAVFDLPAAEGNRLSLNINAPIIASRLLYDEAEAEKVDWPKSWPEPAASALLPQYLIDWTGDPKERAETDKEIDALLAKWLAGVDPKTIKPAVLAKRLASEVMTYIQPIGTGPGNLVYRSDGLYVQGFKVVRALEIIKNPRVADEMYPVLLTAVYRRAGIPSRIIIGLDIEDKRERDPAKASSARTKWVTWAEFALADEVNGEVVWVPVDLARQRRSSSRPGSLDRPWKYFGNHDELDYMIPLAFQFTPPAPVFVRGAPALWGWTVEPMLPPSFAAIKVEALRMNSSDRQKNNR